jgi:hypothetical protein
MDIESTSLVTLWVVNGLVFLSVVVYLCFFYRWDSNKTYDDLAENRVDKYNQTANDMFIGDGDSNIQSLLDKEQAFMYPGLATAGMGRGPTLPLDLQSIHSRIAGPQSLHSYKHSIMTGERDRANSLLGFGIRYAASH